MEQKLRDLFHSLWNKVATISWNTSLLLCCFLQRLHVGVFASVNMSCTQTTVWPPLDDASFGLYCRSLSHLADPNMRA